MTDKPFSTDLPTIAEMVRKMTEEEVRAFVKGEALSIADSSRIEGLLLDQDKLERDLLPQYLAMRTES